MSIVKCFVIKDRFDKLLSSVPYQLIRSDGSINKELVDKFLILITKIFVKKNTTDLDQILETRLININIVNDELKKIFSTENNKMIYQNLVHLVECHLVEWTLGRKGINLT